METTSRIRDNLQDREYRSLYTRRIFSFAPASMPRLRQPMRYCIWVSGFEGSQTYTLYRHLFG